MTNRVDLFEIWKQNFNPNDIKIFIDSNASRLILSFKDMFNWIDLRKVVIGRKVLNCIQKYPFTSI